MGILQRYSHYTSNYFQKASSVHINTCNHLLVFFSIFCSWNISKSSKNIFAPDNNITINEFNVHRRLTHKSVIYVYSSNLWACCKALSQVDVKDSVLHTELKKKNECWIEKIGANTFFEKRTNISCNGLCKLTLFPGHRTLMNWSNFFKLA